MARQFRKDQWKMLFVTMFSYLFFYTGRHNFGWAAQGMSQELSITYQEIGWISFSMLMGYAIGQLINGNLADRLSPKVMILTGGFLSIACNLSISFANSYSSILILWTLNGYFQSMAWGSGSKLISNWWSGNERGKAFGFYTMAAGSSSVMTFLMALLIIQDDQSWRALFRYPILFLLGALVLFALIARSHPRLKGYHIIEVDQKEKIKLNWKQAYKIVFSNKSFLTASVAIGFQSMARYGLIFWVPIHFLGADYKESTNSLWITLLIPIGMAIGAVSFGYISDIIFKSDRIKSIRWGMLCSCGISLLIFFLPQTNQFLAVILMFAAGFFVYGPQANFWTLSPDLLGVKLVGTGIGVMNMFAYVFAAMGEPLFGKIIDHTKNTSNIFLLVAIICALCALIISFVNNKNTIKDHE